MSFLFNRGFAALCAVIFTMVGATSVSATCLVGCTPNQPSGMLDLNGQVALAGNGIATFGGIDGDAFAEKIGGATLELNLGAIGGLCTTPDCTSATGGLMASYSESIIAGANGMTDIAGTPALAANNLASNGMIAAEFPNGLMFGMGSTTQVAGQAGAAFTGDGGDAFATVLGTSTNEGNLNVDGVCPTCLSGQWSLSTGVDMIGLAGANAYSHNSGVPVVVENNTGLAAALQMFVGM